MCFIAHLASLISSSRLALFLIRLARAEITITFPFTYPNSGVQRSNDGLLSVGHLTPGRSGMRSMGHSLGMIISEPFKLNGTLSLLARALALMKSFHLRVPGLRVLLRGRPLRRFIEENRVSPPAAYAFLVCFRALTIPCTRENLLPLKCCMVRKVSLCASGCMVIACTEFQPQHVAWVFLGSRS
jgi:hypothetical protein